MLILHLVGEHFTPSGPILERCRGGGPFLKAFPKACQRECFCHAMPTGRQTPSY
jgi:hypothetical protein